MTFISPWSTLPGFDNAGIGQGASLSKRVRDDMLGMILRGALKPGQRINEPDVAGRLQVSRVPVREALRELESSGLVVSRRHAGAFVRQLEAAEIRDLYQMRALLDGFAGRRACALEPAPRHALLAVLDSAEHAMLTAANSHDVQRYYAENLRFHWAIVASAGNQQLCESYRGIVQKLHLSRLTNLSQDVGMQASIAEHTLIMQALRDGNAAHCEALMAHHVDDAYSRLLHAQPGPAGAAVKAAAKVAGKPKKPPVTAAPPARTSPSSR